MPNNYFITGMPKSGKTTLLTKLVEKMKAQGLRVGGFVSPEEKTHGTRTGFVVEDIESGRKEILASVDIDGPKVAKYHVDIKSFESLALPALRNALRYDIIVIDEIGRMEMKSTKFGELLADILESRTPFIASLHRDYIEDFQAWGEVLMLTPSSRERIYTDMMEKIREIKSAKTVKPFKAPKGKTSFKGKAKMKGKEKKAKLGKNAKKQSKKPALSTKKTKHKPKNRKASGSKLSEKRKAWVSSAKEMAKKRKPSKSAHNDFDKIANDIHRHHRDKGETHGHNQQKHIAPEPEITNRETEHKTQEIEHSQDTRHTTSETDEPEHHKRGWRKFIKEHVGV